MKTKLRKKPLKKDNPNQLLFEFRQASANLQQSVQKFAEASERLAVAAYDTALLPITPTPRPAVVVPLQDKRLRDEIKREVGNLRLQAGITWHEAWCLVYNELYRRTGFCAAVVMVAEGHPKKLDACQAHYMLSALHHTVLCMIKTPCYGSQAELASL